MTAEQLSQFGRGVGIGGSVAGGEVGLGGVIGSREATTGSSPEACAGDGGIVVMRESLGCVGDRRGEQAAEGVTIW
jgi:hypothetical protein